MYRKGLGPRYLISKHPKIDTAIFLLACIFVSYGANDIPIDVSYAESNRNRRRTFSAQGH